MHKFIPHILTCRLVFCRIALGNSHKTDPDKGLTDITAQILKIVATIATYIAATCNILHAYIVSTCDNIANIATKDTYSAVSTFQVMSQERGKEKQEAKLKVLAYLNVVN